MIILQKNITDNLKIWNKALYLKKLADAWYNVPAFIVIPTNIVSDYFQNTLKKKDIISEIITSLKVSKYIVRSSSSLEDNTHSSLAGQFHSEIDVDPEQLENAIDITIEKSMKWSKNNQWDLSLIIQEYIVADYAWITFTRSPKWSRELIIEYHKWIWENIVWWAINPKIEKYYHSEIHNSQQNILLKSLNLNNPYNLWRDFINIEKLFWFPVDIEWCVRKSIVYFLQARRITTLSNKQYEEISVLEWLLENQNKYYYEKNEVSEVCPRPTPFMLSLFDKIYAENWPLHKFYWKNNISFQYVDPTKHDTHIITIIWNQLYINKQNEISSLLKWVEIFSTKNYTPKLWMFKGSFSRLKNLYYLFKIQDHKNNIEKKLHGYFNENWNKGSFKKELDNFLKIYETIYEINYSTARSFKKLQLVIKNEAISFSEIISINKELLDINNISDFNIDTSNFKWNSININDENNFISTSNIKNNLPAEQYWKSLPEWKKRYLKPIISQAIYYEYIREIGRLLTVKYVSKLRDCLCKLDDTHTSKTNIYFAYIDEIISWNIDEKILYQREKEYNQYNKYDFPAIISDSFVLKVNNSPIWISWWISKWRLCSLVELEDNKIFPILPLLEETNDNENIILYVTILSPELTKYFPYINGILSENWWELSHLAIIAREHNIPVVSNCNIWDLCIDYWDIIEINWNNWDIIKK